MNTRAFPSGEALLLSGAPIRRVLVVGGNGAGKTTFATALADRLCLPLVHNDCFSLISGWTARPRDEADALRLEAAAAAAWVLEGGPSILSPEIRDRCDLVVWLDLPLGLRMRRVIWRAVRLFGRGRPELPPGAVEGFGPRKWRFLRQMWRRRHWDTQVVLERLQGYDGPVARLQSPAKVAEFLERDFGPLQDP